MPRPRLRSGLGGQLAAMLLVAGAGCDTIDAGPPTGPPMGCFASPAFYVRHAWPEYLDKYGCGAASCHDSQSGSGYFRLVSVAAPVPAPDPQSPSSTWPEPWRLNLIAASRLLDCADPGSSQLLVVPEGHGQPHPPGDVVGQANYAAVAALFSAWAAAR